MQSNRMRWQLVFSSFFFVLCQIIQISYGLFLVPFFIYRANFRSVWNITNFLRAFFTTKNWNIFFTFLSQSGWKFPSVRNNRNFLRVLFISEFSSVGNNTNFSPKKNWRLISDEWKFDIPVRFVPFLSQYYNRRLNAGK